MPKIVCEYCSWNLNSVLQLLNQKIEVPLCERERDEGTEIQRENNQGRGIDRNREREREIERERERERDRK